MTTKPVATYDSFRLVFHVSFISINLLLVIFNIMTGKMGMMMVNFLAIGLFMAAGWKNYMEFIKYKKEMKQYTLKQKEAEKIKLEQLFEVEAKAQKNKELKEKFSKF